MRIERPGKPQGRHVLLLRHHLGINQTWFAALLETAQTSICLWEDVKKRDALLPAHLAERLLEVWDCFPTPPADGFTETMATVAAYRIRKKGGAAPHLPAELPPGFVELSYPEGKTGPRVLVEETGQRPPEAQQPPPTVGAPAQGVVPLRSSGASSAGAAPPDSSASSRRIIKFGLAASLAMFSFATGCMLSHREPNEADSRYVALSGESYTANATDGNGEMGTAQKRSIPLPANAFSWQKGPPCEDGEIEKVGGCWGKMDGMYPPCPEYTVESEGRCLIAIPAKPKRPSTVTPGQK